MLRSHLLVVRLAASVTLAIFLAACNGTTNSGATDEGAGGGSNPPPSDAGGLPSPGPPQPAGGTGAVLAIRRLYLGDTDRAGMKSSNAWMNYGLNLDGKVSTKDSTDICRPRAGAKKVYAYPDGSNGIDNSFGKNILPILIGLASDAPNVLNLSIADGSFTTMLAIQQLGGGTDYNPLTTRLYGGAPLGHQPRFDGTDQWPVLPELLNDPGDITSSKVVFDQSYVTHNTWVSGSRRTFSLSLSVGGFSLTLNIGSALIAMDLDQTHQSAQNGVVAGVIDTEAFITEVRRVAGAFSHDLCSGSTIDSIANQLRQASDIMRDGSPGSPSNECDGISIGLGFDMAAVQLGVVADPATPQGDPCGG